MKRLYRRELTHGGGDTGRQKLNARHDQQNKMEIQNTETQTRHREEGKQTPRQTGNTKVDLQEFQNNP